MSFAIPQPPSASSDSGSSASLTPTANGHSLGASSSSGAPPASSSLFSSEESKFITDSLSSAESFDPFTIGAPGFKVPSLLPPNIAATHDHLASQSSSSANMLAHNALAEPGAALDMRTRSLSGQNPHAMAFTSSAPGHHDPSSSAQRLNSFNLYGHRPGGATPPGNSPFPGAHIHESYAQAHPAGRHASFSAATGPLSPAAAAAGYGKNKAWQMEQLSFLEAQASRGQQHSAAHPLHAALNEHQRRASASAIFTGPYDNLFFQTPAHLQAQQQHLLQQQQQQQQQQSAQQHNRAPFYPGADDGHAGLAMLGAQFPSSHNFGSLQQGAQAARQHDMRNAAVGGMPNGFSAQALAMFNRDAGLGAASLLGGAEPDEQDAGEGSSTPKGRASRASGPETGSSKPSQRGASAGWAAPAASSASPSGSTGALGLKRTSSGAPKTAPTQGLSLNAGPSGAVIRALADLANLDLDLEGALRMLPSNLHAHFTPPRLEKRTQPHLDMLRQQHIENGLIDASTGLEIKPEPTAEDLEREAEEAEKEKKQHTLLTTEEKKANHIASEQKRRANIRKGYELLCDIVPSLREALEREASTKTKCDDDSSDGSDDEDDKKGKGAGKKKKAAGAGKKGEAEGGIEIDGEKIDGRAGPRSEAVVLMKSLDHMGALVEQYRGLMGRRNRARLAVAKKFGWNALANQPVPDIDRLLAIKVQDWYAAHGDEDPNDDMLDDHLDGDDEEPEVEEEADAARKKSPSKTPKKSQQPRSSKKKTKEDVGMQD
ncbi:hypothetical protein PaG_05317 [Moesziomyces aphidis]|uniref:BHLH domain-containing protein n=1 Tax=Moesziomyces aphidis TaxID=84754 RepID=W3VG30_MOEAP|nr:hypothetical protein PaG_05317 [Moesziomyces aphidis]